MLSLPELFTAGLISEETSTCHPTFFEFPASLHSSLRDISPSRNHSSFSIDFCDSVVHVMYALHSNQCFKNQNREKQVFIFNNSQRETKLIKNVSTTIAIGLLMSSHEEFFSEKCNLFTKCVGETVRDLVISSI